MNWINPAKFLFGDQEAEILAILISVSGSVAALEH
jgi:hypothetical protein